MGLDMYLFRTCRVDGLTPSRYETVNYYVLSLSAIPPALDLDTETGIVGANALRDSIHVEGNSQYNTWYSIFERVAYWRKANAVHAWFVDTVQDGIDECQLSPPITSEQLTELRDRALLVLAAKAQDAQAITMANTDTEVLAAIVQNAHASFHERQQAATALGMHQPEIVAELLLPPQGGFFFGSTDIDSYYYEDLQDTIKQINQVLENTDFTRQVVFYHSSW